MEEKAKILNKILIAKSGATPDEWLPLWMHLEDTAGIMQMLLKEFVSNSFASSCGVSKEELEKSAVFLAYVHDIGKSTVGFQHKISRNVPERERILDRYGFSFRIIIDVPHALAGEEILRLFGCPEGVAAIVGAHHGIPTETGELRRYDLKKSKKSNAGFESFYGNDLNFEQIKSLWKIIIDRAMKRAGVDSLEELPKLSVHSQMLISGLLVVVDWIASNTTLFPLISVDETGDDCLYPDRIECAWEKILFPEMWHSQRKHYTEEEFKESFSFLPNETQRTMVDFVCKTNNPGLFILEAPMGCGKTEAALASTELLASKIGKKGLFFGLPTQATANGIFPRIRNWAETQSAVIYHSIHLKHGSAEQNKLFREIQRGIPEEGTDSGLIVHSWFCDNKKACLADFVIATVDQMLMAALKRRHLMLLHLGLSEKVVVIDEVHAYDAYMNAYLERALQWLGAYHTPVILLSATLPAKRRMSLVRAYLQKTFSDSSFEENEAYPLLTWTDGEEIRQETLPFAGTPKSINIRQCNSDDSIRLIRDAVNAGGCVGVLLNTVSRAQNFAASIRDEVTENVLLYHAQYILPDRVKKEEELLNKIGKTSTPEMRRGLVVVGTQVLEQSLDIDFDLLITDICPMDLLLQRIGRLHRHDRKSDRPDGLKTPVCHVITDEYYNEKSTGTKKIYSEWLLKKTLEYMPSSIVIPEDISLLVQKVYSAKDKSSEYEAYRKEIEKSKQKSAMFLLDVPDDTLDDTIHNILDRNVDTQNNEQAEASVRDGIASIEVLAMVKKNDGTIVFIDGTKLSPNMSEEECAKIAEQRLRLPGRFSQSWNIEKNIRELEDNCKSYIASWQKSHWLAGKLVIFFDEKLETELAGYHLRYSYDNGLVCGKEGKDNE